MQIHKVQKREGTEPTIFGKEGVERVEGYGGRGSICTPKDNFSMFSLYCDPKRTLP